MEREGDDKSDWTSRDALTFGRVKVIVLCCAVKGAMQQQQTSKLQTET